MSALCPFHDGWLRSAPEIPLTDWHNSLKGKGTAFDVEGAHPMHATVYIYKYIFYTQIMSNWFSREIKGNQTLHLFKNKQLNSFLQDQIIILMTYCKILQEHITKIKEVFAVHPSIAIHLPVTFAFRCNKEGYFKNVTVCLPPI